MTAVYSPQSIQDSTVSFYNSCFYDFCYFKHTRRLMGYKQNKKSLFSKRMSRHRFYHSKEVFYIQSLSADRRSWLNIVISG